jgi:hypothetical protein
VFIEIVDEKRLIFDKNYIFLPYLTL